MVHAQRNLGRTRQSLGQLSRALLLFAAARAIRRRHRLLLRRRLQPHVAIPSQGATNSRGLQLRLHQRRRAHARAHVRRLESLDAERHEISRPGARSRTANICRCRYFARFATWSPPAQSSSAKSPPSTPSLADDASEFRKIADDLWGSGSGEHSYQKGRVFGTRIIQDALSALHASTRFRIHKPESDAKFQFVHRKLDRRRSLFHRQSP